MTFKQLQDEVIGFRFNETQRESVKRWLNIRVSRIWTMADWPWSRVDMASLTINAGDNTPTLPSDLKTPIQMLDELGDEVCELEASEFDYMYRYSQINGNQSRPCHFKFTNGVLTLGMTPVSSTSFSLSYRRKIYHLDLRYSVDGSPAVVVGPMSADSDTPPWDSDWHQLLVPGAMAYGLKLENDPTWEPLEQEFQNGVQDLMEFYLPSLATTKTLQYGRDSS